MNLRKNLDTTHLTMRLFCKRSRLISLHRKMDKELHKNLLK